MATPAHHIILHFPVVAPRVADVEKIAALEDPVLRNLLITQCYYELSTVFAERAGLYANWCTFATWASKQAGQTIRGEDLNRAMKAILSTAPDIEHTIQLVTALARQIGSNESTDKSRQNVLGELLTKVTNRAADAVARGNKKVFEEIAAQFARFYAICYHDTFYCQEHLDDFAAELKKGLPPEGQDYLRKAFTRYYISFFEEEEQIKAELCFLANLEIGFHEQTRLQPQIAEALNAAMVDNEEVKTFLYEKLFSGIGLWAQVKLFIQKLLGRTDILNKAISTLTEQLRLYLRMTLTDHLMTLTLPPNNRLHLGKDLVSSFPEHLQEIHIHDLLDLLTEIDPTPGSLLQSGATDWANLQERMHFIADLFRCKHESKELFTEAFTKEQISDMKAGRLPMGDL